MDTTSNLSSLIGRYLDVLAQSDYLIANGRIDEARRQREVAASLHRVIDSRWPLEEIESAYKEQMDKIIADLLSKCDGGSPTVAMSWNDHHDRADK